jgi:small conductance mechanosensitive channel
MEIDVEKIWELATVYGLRVIAALVILVVGRWIAKFVKRIFKKVMTKREVDATITSFVGDLVYILLLAFFVIAALGNLGVQTTSFIAILGAAGLAVGLALKDSLANFAAGFMMILFRPFLVGDYIEGAGTAGTVEKSHIFNTQLKTPDNKTVIVPNAKLTSGNIVNYSTKGTRRVDMTFGIGYDDDIDKAKAIIAEMIHSDERVLPEPAPMIAVAALADSSVNIVARPWVKSSDYWGLMTDLTENIKKRFDKEGVSIPYPQRDVHLYEHKD